MQRLTTAALVFAMIAAPITLQGHGARPPSAPAAVGIYVVNSTADTPDADLGISACADASGHCTLRAAIMQANFTTGPNTITVPSGLYLLTRVGDDDGAVLGDLDVTDHLTIQGAGAGATIVDGNGAVTHDRVFQILSSATNVSLSNLTIRGGQKLNTFDEGGGLLWESASYGHLTLSHVTFEGNSAYYGGGVYLNYSPSGDIVSLDHVIVRANTAATAAAGGLGVSLGDFAEFDMQASQVYSNSAYEGGGLYFQDQGSALLPSIHITNTEFYSNTASLSAGIENRSGDVASPVILVDSQLHDNHAGFYGGAIGNYGTLVISNTALSVNAAGVRGGGLYNYDGGQVDIRRSTLDGNTAQTGGGIFTELFIHNSSALTLTNSTVSGNVASQKGGGLYADGGYVNFFNVTVAANRVAAPGGGPDNVLGGGIWISPTASFFSRNSLLGGNTRRYGAGAPEPDDCVGLMNSLGYNFIQNTDTCYTTNSLGNITGVDPLLGPLQFNGGATRTHALLIGSPAIDAAETNTAGCTDGLDAAIATDQRGWARPYGPHCDIGAFEYYPPALFLPLIRR